MRNQLVREFKRISNSASQSFRNGGEVSKYFEIKKHADNIEKILLSNYKPLMDDFAKRLFNGAKNRINYQTKDNNVEDSEEYTNYEKARDAFIILWLLRKKAIIAETTRRLLDKVIQNGKINNLNNVGIANEIERQLGGTYPVRRATVIAATELQGMSQRAMILMAQNMQNKTFKKIWHTSGDERVRGNKPSDAFDHVIADKEETGLNDPFKNTGEDLMHPADPSGSAGNIIGCRCFITIIEDKS